MITFPDILWHRQISYIASQFNISIPLYRYPVTVAIEVHSSLPIGHWWEVNFLIRHPWFGFQQTIGLMNSDLPGGWIHTLCVWAMPFVTDSNLKIGFTKMLMSSIRCNERATG